MVGPHHSLGFRTRRAAALALLLPALLLAACSPTGPDDDASGAASAGVVTSAASPTPTAGPDAHLTIGYAGDVLIHMPVLADAPDGDIQPLVANEDPWVQGVDLALCQAEVPVTPDGVAPSGYPVFGMPSSIITSLQASGWDGCSTASNHSYDRGDTGADLTSNLLQDHGMGHSGTNRTQAESDKAYQLYTFQREGRTITVAHLATTYEGSPVSADRPWGLETDDVERITAQAHQAREDGADLVVLTAQLGEEYTRDPVQAQRDLATQVAATGEVDVLLGGHPHVPQTNELLPGGPDGQGMWVSYCAGNYISNQSAAQGTVMAGIGIFVWVDVTIPDGGPAHVDSLRWHPFTVDIDGGHRVYDLDALHDGARPEGLTLSTDEIDNRWDTVTSILNPDTHDTGTPSTTGPGPTPVPRS